jgi:hypothetical protein
VNAYESKKIKWRTIKGIGVTTEMRTSVLRHNHCMNRVILKVLINLDYPNPRSNIGKSKCREGQDQGSNYISLFIGSARDAFTLLCSTILRR